MTKYIICKKEEEKWYLYPGNGLTSDKSKAYRYTQKEVEDHFGFDLFRALQVVDIQQIDKEDQVCNATPPSPIHNATDQRYKFKSTKVFDGFSTVFRQHSAKGTHCRFLHGYGISFRVTFEGELDERNWVWDFGGMKRAKTLIDGKQPQVWMDYMFDHTVIVAQDDPELISFKAMEEANIIQLRIIPATGAEKFAQFIFNKLNTFVKEETKNRVRVTQVEFMEHNKNSAIYGE